MHLDSQKKNQEGRVADAAEAYRQYLSLFFDAKQRPTIQSNRASALFETGSFLDAGEQYEEIARTLKNDEELRKTLYNAVLSYFKAIDADTEHRRKNPTAGGLLDQWSLVRARED
ncbi:MAG: hypothetical protein R3C68_18050 [Myxococcota bacterium]